METTYEYAITDVIDNKCFRVVDETEALAFLVLLKAYPESWRQYFKVMRRAVSKWSDYNA